MDKVRIGDICTVVNGSTPKSNIEEYWNGDIKWITPAEITDDSYVISDTERHITEKAVEKTNLTLLPVGAVLLSSRAPIGKTAIVGAEMYCNQGFKNLICSERIYNKYLYFFLTSKVDYLNALGRGATFKEISKGIVEDVEIPLPSLDEQKKIAERFEAIQQLLNKQKQALLYLDNLVKSRFVEMFGDPVTNPMRWETGTLADVIRGKASNGFFAKRNAYKPDGNVAVLGVVDVVNRMYSKTTDLPRTDATKKDIEKYRVEYGDVLFCRSSLVQAGIGKASIVPKGVSEDILFECHVIRLRLDMNKCIPEFIQQLTATEYCRNQIMAVSKTATMTTIGQDGILATKIYIPPLDLQNKFLTLVEQADKSKYAVQKSIETLQTLKAKLMQDYFG